MKTVSKSALLKAMTNAVYVTIFAHLLGCNALGDCFAIAELTRPYSGINCAELAFALNDLPVIKDTQTAYSISVEMAQGFFPAILDETDEEASHV